MLNKRPQPSKKNDIQKIIDNQLFTQVMQTAIDAALLKHKQAGHPICIWKEGKVVWIPASEIFSDHTDLSLPKEITEKIDNGQNAIYVIRQHRGFTQAVLADQAQVSKQYISQLENDEKTGSIYTLKKIAAALNVRLEDLVPQRK